MPSFLSLRTTHTTEMILIKITCMGCTSAALCSKWHTARTYFRPYICKYRLLIFIWQSSIHCRPLPTLFSVCNLSWMHLKYCLPYFNLHQTKYSLHSLYFVTINYTQYLEFEMFDVVTLARHPGFALYNL